MPRVITEKYRITLRDPKTGEETTSISTQEVGGPTIEQTMGSVWNELNLQFVGKELIHATEEQKIAPDEDGVVPQQPPDMVQRRVIQQGSIQQPQQHPLQGNAKGPFQPVSQPINIPEKIIQHGDVKLKLVGEKVFIEEWVEKKKEDGYKIIGENSSDVTNSVTILHKEWVELKEEEKEEKEEPPVESLPIVESLSETTTNTITISDEENEAYDKAIENLI